MQRPDPSSSTASGERITTVRDLLPFLLHVPVTYRFSKKNVSLDGFITDGGYSCACSAAASCGYRGKVLSALQFEKHAGVESKNQNGHIFLSNGISLYSLFQELRDVPAEAFAEKFEAAAGVPMTMASRRKDYSDAVASDDGCSTQSSRDSAMGDNVYSLTDYLKESTSNSLSNLNWRRINLFLCLLVLRDTTLHPLLFKESGLPDNTLLIYKLRNGEVLKQGYKRGTCIICDCCNKEFTPSHFEEHAGMGRRRQPYHNIYTSEGVTLHNIALQLQDRLNPNGFGNANISSFSDYPNVTSGNVMQCFSPDHGVTWSLLTSSASHLTMVALEKKQLWSCGKEPSTTNVPIVPLKRTLQERVVETESCYICRDGHTTVGNIDSDTIVFCNQCERPCHIRCYNDGLAKRKAPLEILKEYMQFCFLCCEKCQMLRAHLDEELEKCEEIAFLRRVRSNICWRLLSGTNKSNDVQLYIPQVIDIFRDAFAETAEHSGFFSDMVYTKNVEGEKDFRGMYCAVLTASTHVVSAAILKVRMEQVAELVLIATRSECRRKGYFVLLLNSIEAHLRAWNVNLLMAPVDPEMAPIWSEKLGFTILSDEEKKSMLEVHPLVMFENLLLVQKSLA
nr:unnamed protein product [Digitaria exilis]